MAVEQGSYIKNDQIIISNTQIMREGILTERNYQNSNTNSKQDGYVDFIPEPEKGCPELTTKMSPISLK